MISLLAPVGLAALAAWLVPLLLHWVRRSDRQVVLFAAMRYLREETHPRERLRLYEPWLLLLRLLLIAALALVLAVPILRGPGAASAPWVLVAPGVTAAAARAAVPLPLAQWHWLAPGLPPLDAPVPPPEAGASLSSLLRQADLELPPRAAVTLVVPEELGGLDAERVRLAHAFTWRVLPGATPVITVAGGADQSGGAETGSRTTGPLALAVRTDAIGAGELPLVRAVTAAWQVDGVNVQWDIAPAATPLPVTPGWLIWLAGPLPSGIDAWVRRGGTVLASRQTERDAGEVVLSDAAGTPVLRERELGRGRVLSLAGPLQLGEPSATTTAQNAVGRASLNATLSAADFPHTLLVLMRGSPRPPDRAAAAAVAPLATGHAPLAPAQFLSPDIALGVALLFLAERLLATRRRVGA
jgi:hypothetical protein